MLSSWSRIQTCTGNVITEGHMCWRTSAEANSHVFLAASTLLQLFALLIKLTNIMNQWVLGVQRVSLKFNMMTTRFLIVQNSLPALSYFWGEIVAKLCRAGIPSTQLAQVGLGKVSAPPSWLLPPPPPWPPPPCPSPPCPPPPWPPPSRPPPSRPPPPSPAPPWPPPPCQPLPWCCPSL